MKNNNSKNSLWFPQVSDQPNVKFRLFCFPFAGGNTQTYIDWKNHLPDEIDVCPVQLPGRANRINEKCFTDLKSLINAIKVEIHPYLDFPFAIFGHSMGALIAFELAKELNLLDYPPKHLFLSGARAPHIESRTPNYHDLPLSDFKNELKNLSGTPIEVLEHPELLDLLLPILRADFKLVETYKISEIEPINVPISTFGGDDDFEVFESELFEWARYTSASFKGKIFSGNHFYFKENLEDLLNNINNDLSQYLISP